MDMSTWFEATADPDVHAEIMAEWHRREAALGIQLVTDKSEYQAEIDAMARWMGQKHFCLGDALFMMYCAVACVAAAMTAETSVDRELFARAEELGPHGVSGVCKAILYNVSTSAYWEPYTGTLRETFTGVIALAANSFFDACLDRADELALEDAYAAKRAAEEAQSAFRLHPKPGG